MRRSGPDAFTGLLIALALLVVVAGAAALFADARRPAVYATDGGAP